MKEEGMIVESLKGVISHAANTNATMVETLIGTH